MKRPVKIKTYEDGWNDRDKKTILHGRDPFTNWDWGEWAVYVGFTCFGIAAFLLLFWFSGVYIRWQVGPVAPIASALPYSEVGTGWHTSGCEEKNQPTGQQFWQCFFFKD
jgi:hypothetical protein